MLLHAPSVKGPCTVPEESWILFISIVTCLSQIKIYSLKTQDGKPALTDYRKQQDAWDR